jgi:hypothetical protein
MRNKPSFAELELIAMQGNLRSVNPSPCMFYLNFLRIKKVEQMLDRVNRCKADIETLSHLKGVKVRTRSGSP